MVNARRKGFTFIDVLMASLIIGVVIGGVISLWNVCQLSIRDTGETNDAGQIARAELERVKVYGISNFPKGSLTCSVGDGAVWTGSYSPSSGTWVSGAVSYYDYKGTWLASSTGATFSLQVTVTDNGDLPPSPCSGLSTSNYDIIGTTRRYAVASVTRLRDNSVIFTSGTEMVIGGL